MLIWRNIILHVLIIYLTRSSNNMAGAGGSCSFYAKFLYWRASRRGRWSWSTSWRFARLSSLRLSVGSPPWWLCKQEDGPLYWRFGRLRIFAVSLAVTRWVGIEYPDFICFRIRSPLSKYLANGDEVSETLAVLAGQNRIVQRKVRVCETGWYWYGRHLLKLIQLYQIVFCTYANRHHQSRC